MKKKLLSVLLATVLLLTCIPLGAVSVSAAKSGITGDCTWTLDDTGHLIISGNGEMGDGEFSLHWGTEISKVTIENGVTAINYRAFRYCTKLTTVTIGDSVTTIGSDAFYGCTSLTAVTIPDSVTYIGSDAFYGCTSLTAITIPDSVTRIGGCAFYGCTSLTAVTIPDSVTYIGSDAFYGCTSLTAVTIPDSVTTIGSDAFENCTSLTAVHISDLAAWCQIEFGDLDANPLRYARKLYLNEELVTETIIPDGVTAIGVGAFYGCTGLTAVTIPDSVASIGSSAFSKCTGLTSVIIPDSVTSIGDYAFISTSILRCYKNSFAHTWAENKGQMYALIDGTDEESIVGGKIGKLTWSLDKRTGLLEITGSGAVVDFDTATPPWEDYKYYVMRLAISDSVTGIGYSAFSGCTNLTTVTIPDSVTSIDWYAFSGCTSLTTVTMGDSVTNIGDFAFAYCDRLTTVTISDSVTTIDFGAFRGCDSLITVTIGDSVTTIGGYAFADCTSLTTVTIPDSVTTIGSNAFEGCTSLTAVTIPDSVTNIGYSAFSGCTGLTSVTIPYSVRYIEYGSFSNCDSLSAITIYSTDCQFDSGCGFNYTHTIYGFVGSTAEAFAEQVGAEFIDVETVHTHEYRPATCTQASFCPVCGKTDGDALGHAYDNACDTTCNTCGATRVIYHTYVAATCTKPKTCFVCGETEGDALGHDYKAHTTSPNCVNGGYTTYTCYRCGDSYVADEVEALGHSFADATCTKPKTCFVCGETEGDALGHDYKAYINTPNCVNGGYTTYTCYRCGDSYVADEVEALGHAWLDATCTAPETCSVCGITEGRALGHAYDDRCDTDCNDCGEIRTVTHVFAAATCTNPKTCKVCGATDGEDLGHIFTAATCTAPETCSVCGITEGRALGHVYDDRCDTDCNVCGEIRTVTHVFAVATCTNPKTCKVCGATDGEALGHKYTNTCDDECNVCGFCRKITHKYATVTKKATTTANGYTVKRCSVCQKETGKTTLYKASKITLSTTTYTYNGSAKKPSVTVKDSQGNKISSSNYTVTYASGRKNVGTYKVAVKFKGNYSGTKTLTFKINPAKTSVKSLTAGTKKLTVAITKKTTQVTGYQIQYSTSKSFKTYKTKTLTSYKTVSASLTGLSAKKTYYVRVRTYKTVGGVKYYSGWSTIQYKKTK